MPGTIVALFSPSEFSPLRIEGVGARALGDFCVFGFLVGFRLGLLVWS